PPMSKWRIPMVLRPRVVLSAFALIGLSACNQHDAPPAAPDDMAVPPARIADAGPQPAADLASAPSPSPDGAVPVSTCTPNGQPFALAQGYGIKGDIRVAVKVPSGCSGSSCLLDATESATFLLFAQAMQNGQQATLTVQPCNIDFPQLTLAGGGAPVIITVP